MKVTVHRDGVSLTAESDKISEIFNQLSKMDEVFGETRCGKCDSSNIHYRLRKATDDKKKKEFIYPEMICKHCYSKLSYGQTEEGTLFPIRFVREDGEYVKDSDGKNIPKGKNGWVKFNKETGKEE